MTPPGTDAEIVYSVAVIANFAKETTPWPSNKVPIISTAVINPATLPIGFAKPLIEFVTEYLHNRYCL